MFVLTNNRTGLLLCLCDLVVKIIDIRRNFIIKL